MDKLKMHSINKVDENVEKIGKLFPNCVTETIVDDKLTKVIDFDMLRQELSSFVVEGREERYQFTWSDKKKSILLANAPINKTLRPCREESVNFDTTENLYIEGDNLEVLKLLQETYLGRIKMIYIDPPYNTGSDFVYEDDFAQDAGEYIANSGQYDAEGNRLVQNTESNGRFHTDWLNMIYPRLKLAKDLLTDDGVIFISIDDGELDGLKKVCNEVFGASNFRNTILTRRRIKSLNSQFADNGLYSMNVGFEYVLVYAKSPAFLMRALRMKKDNVPDKGRWDVFWSNADRPTMRYDVLGFTPTTGQWRNSKEKADTAVANYRKYQTDFESRMSLEEYSEMTGITDFIRRIPNGTGKNGGVQHWVAPSDTSLRTSNWTDIEVSQIGKEIALPFDNPKSKQLLMELVKLADLKNDDFILDFFSGSATTAHAVMQLNAEDGGHRKFIMVQLPEETVEKSEAYQAGYKNICEIGKERIRQAGKKIVDEAGLTAQNLDIGFRVLKCDSSNMKEVYYSPSEYTPSLFSSLTDNIKEDRTPEDLLFQVMLDLGVLLSSKIEETTIAGKKVFSVADGYLIACFDENITDETIKEIAQKKPYYFVMRDGGYASDSVATNFDQIFTAYSPSTIRKVL
jgi:Adenine specific DNA methylase Mod